jgi:ABC-type lipoprotein export system ATPase subunit
LQWIKLKARRYNRGGEANGRFLGGSFVGTRGEALMSGVGNVIQFDLDRVKAGWGGVGQFSAYFDQLRIALPKGGNLLPLRGETGSGKTTLLYILAAMKWPSAGVVIWTLPEEGGTFKKRCWGPDASSIKETGAEIISKECLNEFRRRHFGVTFQDGRLLNHLTVEDNLCYPLELRKIPRSQALSTVHTRIQPFLTGTERGELNKLLAKFPDQCSGGQQRRIALAKAVIWNPTVLFADEPSGNLDPQTRLEVMTALYEWSNGESVGIPRAVIWVTHVDDDEANAKARHRLTILSQDKTSSSVPAWRFDRLLS